MKVKIKRIKCATRKRSFLKSGFSTPVLRNPVFSCNLDLYEKHASVCQQYESFAPVFRWNIGQKARILIPAQTEMQ